jgi:hypothetical protein
VFVLVGYLRTPLTSRRPADQCVFCRTPMWFSPGKFNVLADGFLSLHRRQRPQRVGSEAERGALSVPLLLQFPDSAPKVKLLPHRLRASAASSAWIR